MTRGYNRERSEETLPERFWSKVDKRGPDECWPWTAETKWNHGYGFIRVDDRMRTASRVSWEIANGPIPPRMNVCHSCDNPPCVNPAHLWLGSQADNARDMAAKGRAWQQKKTHCKHGHEFTAENTYVWNGHRSCRACNRAAVDIHQRKHGRQRMGANA